MTRFVPSGVVLKGSCQEGASLGRRILQDLGWRGFLVVDSLDLVGRQVLVENLLQGIGIGRRTRSHEVESFADFAPHQLLLRHFVVSSELDDVIEQLEEVDDEIAHFGFGVEIGATLLVKHPEIVDELLIFGSAINYVFPLRRSHDAGGCGRDGGPSRYLGFRWRVAQVLTRG